MAQETPGSTVPRFAGRTHEETPLDPAPPYQVEFHDFLFAEAVFDPDAVRAALPPGLEPLDDHSGAISFFKAPHGWGLAPFSNLNLGVFVKGHDTTDGAPGNFQVFAYFTGKAAQIFPRDYNTRSTLGAVRQWQENDHYWCEAGPPGQPMVRFGLHSPSDAADVTYRSGIHHYIGQKGASGQTIHTVGFSGQDVPANVVSYEALPAATDVIKSLVPLRWTFACRTPRMAVTFGAPRPLLGSTSGLAADATNLSLMDILSRIGLAVALVTPDGRILFINNLARQMLSGALAGGRLTAWRRQDRTQLGSTLAALQPGRLSHPVALRRPDGGLPLLARAVPVGAAVAGEAAALILFSDPAAPVPTADLTLVMLGLTPAEARIAAQVGRGLTTREAAQVVGVTDSTARSTLKAVYGKLGIGKQSELALIVARLEGYG